MRLLIPLALAGAAAAWLVSVSVRAYLVEAADFAPRPQRLGNPGRSGDVPAPQELVIATSAGDIHAWWYPSRNGAAVLLTHGSGGSRREMLPDAQILARAGFGALLLDLPGHGESPGVPRWGAPEREAIGAGLAWLSAARGVVPDRLGAVAFSMSTYVLVQVAARDPRVRALVLQAPVVDVLAHTRREWRRLGPLTQWPAVWAVRRHMGPEVVSAADDFARIAPRPLLLVAGQRDPVVTPDLVREMRDQAKPPCDLLVVPEAAHGGYATAGGRYPEVLVKFFDAALNRS